MELEGAPVFAGWECIEKLGEGGMCSVWRVRPRSGDGPERAIKVLHDSHDAAVKRFADEARLLQRIDHPNVLRIHELHDEVRPPWIVMDLLAGRDLEETREEQGAMDPERAARLIADVSSGLARVHALGVRHRDIKPANIMIGHDGIPRLIDFGIARETSKAHVTQQGFVVGTASYLPPEIFVEDDAHSIQDTESADIYALGQTLCELLTGHPLHGRNLTGSATMLVQIMKDKMDRPHLDPRQWRQVPDELAEIVIAATKQEPSERIQTARELEDRLRAWVRQRHAGEDAPLTAVDPMALPPPPRPRATPGGSPERHAERATPAPVSAAHAASAPPPPKRAESAPARRGGGAGTAAVGAAGMGLVGLVSAGVLLVTVIGMVAIVALAPGAPAASPRTVAAVEEAAQGARTGLGRCARDGTAGDVVLSFRVDGGRVKDAVVEGADLGDEVERCLTRRIASVDFPRGEAVAVRMPIQFKPPSVFTPPERR